MKKVTQHIGLFSFVVYFLFTCIYYQERTLFLDNAFQVFLMIVEGDIAVNAHRWPAVVIRLLPYLLIQIQAPLKVVLFSFSLSYFLFHFVIFVVIRYQLKNRTLALLQLATISLPVIHSFFWCNSEQNLAMSLLILTLALYRKSRFFWTAVLCFLLLWLHPLTFLPFGFVMVFSAIDESKKGFTETLIPIGFGTVFTIAYILKSVFIKNWYDTMKAKEFKTNLSVYDFEQIEFLKIYFSDTYIIFPFMVLMALVYLIYKRVWLKAMLYGVFVAVYLMILHISSFQATNYIFYNEVNYLILFFVASYVLTDFVLEQSQMVRALIFSVAFSLVLFNWISTSVFYTDRIEWMHNIAISNDRRVIDTKEIDRDKLVMPWASAYESIIISTLRGKSCSTLIADDIDRFETDEIINEVIMEFGNYDLEEVNKSYFDLERKSYKK